MLAFRRPVDVGKPTTASRRRRNVSADFQQAFKTLRTGQRIVHIKPIV
jgi:hypothetical protein